MNLRRKMAFNNDMIQDSEDDQDGRAIKIDDNNDDDKMMMNGDAGVKFIMMNKHEMNHMENGGGGEIGGGGVTKIIQNFLHEKTQVS